MIGVEIVIIGILHLGFLLLAIRIDKRFKGIEIEINRVRTHITLMKEGKDFSTCKKCKKTYNIN